ncbi:hypothetical protein JM83_2892 [Gillisia sp. Hel_I_86]|nr:hypothetical protein JM83_2892 [Gillisia sp. Hel_I_86]
MASCGPIVVTSRPNHPPLPWFYPNRVEEVRYVYFPEHSIYYDFAEQLFVFGKWYLGAC